MPAHVTSAVASYPELSCHERPVGVPSGGVWPITDIYCAGKESTFEFLEDVLTEVMDLFPSKYIHVGGDEATKTEWKKCAHCQERMKNEGLANVEELQSYFIQRMERFISSKGRSLIGWDEILEGGLAPGAAVMSWRGFDGGIEASADGHHVVMTPGSHCYFDQYQGAQNAEPLAIGGHVTLSKVYEFDPIVPGMTAKQATYVLGGQANLWSEYITTESHSEYMIFPRLAALSETVWSPKDKRNWNDFSRRVQVMFQRFDIMGINYAKSAYQVSAELTSEVTSPKVIMDLKNEFPGGDIRYVLNDGIFPSEAKLYTAPLEITQSTKIKAALFQDDKPSEVVYENIIRFHKAIGKKIDYATKPHEWYPGNDSTLVDVLRGTKNFHDKKWQAWLVDDMELTIDLEGINKVSKVVIGTMENQGSGIYYPIKLEVMGSEDGKNFVSVGSIERAYKNNGYAELKEFEITFKEQLFRYIKVKGTNLGHPPHGGDSWLFVDEIIIE